MSRNPVTQPGYHVGRTPANKGRSYPPEILTPQEAVDLFRACSQSAPTGLRNGALIAVLYRGGLRLGEALALMSKDIDQNRGIISVLHGKGDRHRVVGLDPGAMAIVGRWSDRRLALGLNGRLPFFCTLDGAALKPSYVRTLLPRMARRAGIEKRVHPHGLRHTHAFELMIEGVPVSVIQKQLGHASLSTTDRYLRHVAPTDVIIAMQERVWLV